MYDPWVTTTAKSMDPMLRQAVLARQSLIKLAREDSSLFCDLVLSDEATGIPITSVGMHEEWHHVANTGKNMVIWAHPESGKSQQLVIGRTLWLLGRNPRYRIAILAAAEKQAKKLIGSLRRHIEMNAVLHEIFPELQRGEMWTDNAITIKRDGIIKDPSVQAISPNGAVQGARLDFLFIDDILVEDNTRTAYQRDKLSTWVRTSAFSRLSHGAQIVFVANAFHPEDMAHELAKQKGWWAKKYPVLDEQGKPTWPERWPLHRIEKTRDEDMGPTEFNRMMMCEPRADGDSRFKQEWIDACKERGKGIPLFLNLESFVSWCGAEFWAAAGVRWGDFKSHLSPFPPGFATYTGVDLGVSKKKKADPSVIFTILVWPDGTRQILDVQRGKWSAPEIIRRVVSAHYRFTSLCVVETNAAQSFLLQWISRDHPNVRIKGFTTGKNKLSPEFGIESVATELEQVKWVIPCEETGELSKELRILVQEMLFYAPDGHTGDILMAQWVAREAARAFSGDQRSSGVQVRAIG